MSQERDPSGLKSVARATGITVLLTLLLFVLLEGASGTVLFVRDFIGPRGAAGPGSTFASPGGAARQHTQPDEELGWVHRPNVNIPDFYGPGRHFRTNSQALRNDSDFTAREPQRRVRVICSGDSFTLGQGVANPDTWCAQLAALDPRLETVNMGQVGYGLGQSYLWYRREGTRFEHSVIVLAFITADIARMRRDDFRGVPKPRLELEDDALVVRNVPIEPVRLFPLSEERVTAIRELRTVRVASAILRRLGFSTNGGSRVSGQAALTGADSIDRESRAIVDALIRTLLHENRESGRQLVLLHLPVRPDYRAEHRVATEYGLESSGAWRRHLARQAPNRGFAFIDMIESFNQLTSAELERMFLPRTLQSLRAGGGHLSELGNTRVARAVYDRLREMDELSDRLGEPAP